MEIIDISQPVSSRTACFPGDVPFSRQVTLTYRESKIVNLTAMTLSPHVGTHADAPSHICGELSDDAEMAGTLPLTPFIGDVTVIDLSPLDSAITADHLRGVLKSSGQIDRLLVKTQKLVEFDNFADEYAYFSVEAVEYAASQGIKLLGIDTPSVDHVRSKTLEAHHAMHRHKLCWLENLDLTNAQAGDFFLVALPLKLMELEASPVRAILLRRTPEI